MFSSQVSTIVCFMILCTFIKCDFPRYYPVNETLVGWNETCDPENNIFCIPNLWCNQENLCQRDNIGLECQHSDNCSYSVCVGGVCSAPLTNGYDCSESSECLSGHCNGKYCIGVRVENVSCDIDKPQNCLEGFFCNSKSKCQKIYSAGEECTNVDPEMSDYLFACEPGYICDYNGTETCVRPYSVSKGDTCGSSYVCKRPYSCYKWKCSTTTEECYNSTLLCPESSWCNVTGSDSSECAFWGNTDVQDIDDEFIDCMIENECPFGVPPVENSCGYENCFDIWQERECLYYESYSDYKLLYRVFNCDPTPPPDPSFSENDSEWELTFAIIGPCVFVFIVSILGFFLYRNRSTRNVWEKDLSEEDNELL
ncbi:hypothetical protein M0813_17822 [Anaeramoeba flamelloides]|uniref:Uncharacterized protein n=2 Tax=Anaeramoeba flamelloides TaxID=1746091 RepID=A0ABQ8YU42_9EUKA|nr:hypothetical protein M0813_17822 [Anaeramoeba flamelloides]